MTRKQFLDKYLVDNNLTLDEFREGFIVLKALEDGYEVVVKGKQMDFIRSRRAEGLETDIEEPPADDEEEEEVVAE